MTLIPPLRHFAKALRIARAVGTDPVESWFLLQSKLAERAEVAELPCAYQVDPHWEARLPMMFGTGANEGVLNEFWPIWFETLNELAARGMQVGPANYGIYNDGDPAFVRALWFLVRHLRPAKVVETGVAHGLTSRFILEALGRNGTGHLWSIDLPPLLQPELARRVGAAVDQRHRNRWSLIRGSSRRRLPRLLEQIGPIDLFVHDSRHSESNVRFELDLAWAATRPGMALVVDDIDLNWGYRSFVQANRCCQFLCCPAEPVRPDPGPRFDGRGLFGIIRKGNPSQRLSPRSSVI